MADPKITFEMLEIVPVTDGPNVWTVAYMASPDNQQAFIIRETRGKTLTYEAVVNGKGGIKSLEVFFPFESPTDQNYFVTTPSGGAGTADRLSIPVVLDNVGLFKYTVRIVMIPTDGEEREQHIFTVDPVIDVGEYP